MGEITAKTPWIPYLGVVPPHLEYFQGTMFEAVEKVAEKYPEYIAFDFMDADLQDDVNAIDQMVDEFESGCDIVYGVRSRRATDTFFKRFTAEGFYKLMSKADTVYAATCRDILANGVWDTDREVRPHWEDGTPAHTIKKFCVVNRYNLQEEFPIMCPACRDNEEKRDRTFGGCVSAPLRASHSSKYAGDRKTEGL